MKKLLSVALLSAAMFSTTAFASWGVGTQKDGENNTSYAYKVTPYVGGIILRCQGNDSVQVKLSPEGMGPLAFEKSIVVSFGEDNYSLNVTLDDSQKRYIVKQEDVESLMINLMQAEFFTYQAVSLQGYYKNVQVSMADIKAATDAIGCALK